MLELESCHLVLRYSGLRVLDPGRVSRLAASLVRDGQRSPVLVVEGSVLVDGYHRVAALQELGRDLVKAVELRVTEAEALVLAWRLERGHRLVRALPESVQEAVRASKVPAQAAMKSLVPMARRDPTGCEQLVAALPEPVSVRQMARLYAAWKAADAKGRERIVAQPMLLLKAEEATSSVSLDAEERLARDLEGVAGLCRRARRAVGGGVFARANRGLVEWAWEQASGAFRSLEEEVERARS